MLVTYFRCNLGVTLCFFVIVIVQVINSILEKEYIQYLLLAMMIRIYQILDIFFFYDDFLNF